MQKTKKVVCLLGAVMLAAGMMAFPVCAKEANVAGVIEETRRRAPLSRADKNCGGQRGVPGDRYDPGSFLFREAGDSIF